MHGFQKTVHGPGKTMQHSGEKESPFLRKQPPNASRSRVFGEKGEGIGVGQASGSVQFSDLVMPFHVGQTGAGMLGAETKTPWRR